MRLIFGVLAFIVLAQAVSYSTAQEFIVAEGYSSSNSTFVVTDDDVTFSEPVVVGMYDANGFVDNVTLFSLDEGEGAIGFSNSAFPLGTVLVGQMLPANGNELGSTVIIVMDPPTHREQACKIVDGGHIQSDHADDFPDADTNGDGEISGETETDILKDILEGIMDDAGANDKKTAPMTRKRLLMGAGHIGMTRTTSL